jgi:hypothetical protein
MKFFFLIIPLFLLAGCSASTGSRYEKTEKNKETAKNEGKKESEIKTAEFNPYPYRETFDIKAPPGEEIDTKDLDLFFTYDKDTSLNNQPREIIDTVDGYRVQIIAADNLEEANQIRSEVYFKTNQKSLYVVFEPPFYKVKAGDFLNINDAREFSFRLNQMGYKESKVVSEKVNVFK